MSPDNGANPMLWNCEVKGCFNRVKRPKIEIFADCLPGRIAFTDVDGLVEIAGNLLFLEWKEHTRIGTGQRILFERITRFCPAVVILVEGDARDMTVESLCIAWEGQIGPWRPATIDDLRRDIKAWAVWAKGNPVQSHRKRSG